MVSETSSGESVAQEATRVCEAGHVLRVHVITPRLMST